MKNEANRILLKCHFVSLAVGIMCHHKGTSIENLWRIVSFTCVLQGKNALSQQLNDGEAMAVSLQLADI